MPALLGDTKQRLPPYTVPKDNRLHNTGDGRNSFFIGVIVHRVRRGWNESKETRLLGR